METQKSSILPSEYNFDTEKISGITSLCYFPDVYKRKILILGKLNHTGTNCDNSVEVKDYITKFILAFDERVNLFIENNDTSWMMGLLNKGCHVYQHDKLHPFIPPIPDSYSELSCALVDRYVEDKRLFYDPNLPYGPWKDDKGNVQWTEQGDETKYEYFSKYYERLIYYYIFNEQSQDRNIRKLHADYIVRSSLILKYIAPHGIVTDEIIRLINNLYNIISYPPTNMVIPPIHVNMQREIYNSFLAEVYIYGTTKHAALCFISQYVYLLSILFEHDKKNSIIYVDDRHARFYRRVIEGIMGAGPSISVTNYDGLERDNVSNCIIFNKKFNILELFKSGSAVR